MSSVIQPRNKVSKITKHNPINPHNLLEGQKPSAAHTAEVLIGLSDTFEAAYKAKLDPAGKAKRWGKVKQAIRDTGLTTEPLSMRIDLTVK